MTRLTMTTATPEARSAVGAALSAPAAATVVHPIDGIGTPDDVRQEINDAYQDAQGFHNMEPDEIIRLVSGHCARLSTIRTIVGRFDGHPVWRRVKVELEECLQEMREQFNYASRIISSRELDWKIETGGRQT